MKKELEDIRALFWQAYDSMEVAVWHYDQKGLFQVFQLEQARERKKSYKGAMRKLDKLIKQSNDGGPDA